MRQDQDQYSLPLLLSAIAHSSTNSITAKPQNQLQGAEFVASHILVTQKMGLFKKKKGIIFKRQWYVSLKKFNGWDSSLQY